MDMVQRLSRDKKKLQMTCSKVSKPR